VKNEKKKGTSSQKTDYEKSIRQRVAERPISLRQRGFEKMTAEFSTLRQKVKMRKGKRKEE